MSLKKQQQEFVEAFLASGNQVIPLKVVTDVLAPFLADSAKALKIEKLYAWADPFQDKLAKIVLQKRDNHQEMYQVIYFFASEQDAKRHPHFDRLIHRVVSITAMEALMLILTSSELDKGIFYPQKGRLNRPDAVNRSRFVETFQSIVEEFAPMDRFFPVA